MDFLKQLATDPLSLGTASLHTFLLVFLRVGGMFIRAPFWGSGMFPANVRIWLSVAVALLLFPVQLNQHGAVILQQSSGVFLTACIAEFGLGLVIGFCAQILLFGMLMAGHVIDNEMGFGLATVFDPVTSEPTALTGQVLFLGAMLGFLALDGHHTVLTALNFSFARIPLCQASFSDDAVRWILLTLAPQVFVIGVTFAAPVLAAVLLTTMGLALMARVIPEMNIFAFSFTARLIVGFVFLVFSVNYLAPVADRLVQGTYGHLAAIIVRMG
ncbi:MAG: flagellar biosynthetic protein FliR [Planctomycetes bacterium]|nr:flagellar biosynthetic protein FliR [Planctomycetota bacterium]